MRDSQRRLKEFSRKSIEALEADRMTISRELHDSIGGNLAALKVSLESVVKKIAERPSEAASSLEKTIYLADTIKECKQISASLRPEIIDDMGFRPPSIGTPASSASITATSGSCGKSMWKNRKSPSR